MELRNMTVCPLRALSCLGLLLELCRNTLLLSCLASGKRKLPITTTARLLLSANRAQAHVVSSHQEAYGSGYRPEEGQGSTVQGQEVVLRRFDFDLGQLPRVQYLARSSSAQIRQHLAQQD